MLEDTSCTGKHREDGCPAHLAQGCRERMPKVMLCTGMHTGGIPRDTSGTGKMPRRTQPAQGCPGLPRDTSYTGIPRETYPRHFPEVGAATG